MANQPQSRLDPLNVAYGIGAAIVLTGAMFKFLNWTFANEMLFIGLTTEALVFLISAFERSKIDQSYSWEKVFPQLNYEDSSPIEQLQEMVEKANLDPIIIERLTNSIEQLEQNVQKMTEASESGKLSEQLGKMNLASEKFEGEMTSLTGNLSKMNEFYSQTDPSKSLKLVEQLDKMNDASESFEKEMTSLSGNLSKMNRLYDMGDSTESKKMVEHLEKMNSVTEKFESEMNSISDSLSKMNDFYDKMLVVMGKRGTN